MTGHAAGAKSPAGTEPRQRSVPVVFVTTGHRSRTTTRNARARLDLARAGDDFVVQVGWQHAHDGVQRLDAREPAPPHPPRLRLSEFLDLRLAVHPHHV